MMKRTLWYMLFIGLGLVACRQSSTDPNATPTLPLTRPPDIETTPLSEGNGQTERGEASNNQVATVVARNYAEIFDPANTELPASCQPAPNFVQYISLQAGICFTYPEQFSRINIDPEKSQIIITESGDQAVDGATLLLETTIPLPANLTLLSAVQAFIAQFPDGQIQALPAGIGRDEAFIINGVPDDVPSRQILAVHEDGLYHLNFFPVDSESTEQADAELALWRAVTGSFGYLTQGFIDQYVDCPDPIADVAPYFDLIGNYCFSYPFADEVVLRPLPTLSDGLPAGVELDLPASSVTFSILPIQQMGDQTLREAVSALPEISDALLTETTIGMDNLSALVIDGMAVEDGSQMQAFVAHEDLLYRFTINPTDDVVQTATAIRFWSDALATFRFLSGESSSLMAPSSNVDSEDAGITATTDVTIEAVDGLQIAGTFYPTQGDGRQPAVLLLHMLNSNRIVWADFAAQLNESGYSVLAVDMRGHGETGGVKDWELAADDLGRAWDFLAHQPNVDAGKTAIIGGSIGANMALIAGANDPNVAGVALLSPGLDYAGVKTENALAEYGDRPLLIVASEEDNYAANSSMTLADLSSQSQLIMYNGAGHGTRMFDAEPTLAQTLIDWLNEVAE